MTVSRKTSFSLQEVRAVLASWGWEVAQGDTLSAEWYDGSAHLRLVIDKGGRMILRRTILAEKPVGAVVHRDGRTFAVQREMILVSHVMTTIETPDVFEETLSEMLSLIKKPPEGMSG